MESEWELIGPRSLEWSGVKFIQGIEDGFDATELVTVAVKRFWFPVSQSQSSMEVGIGRNGMESWWMSLVLNLIQE
jgi:hypothetical protein